MKTKLHFLTRHRGIISLFAFSLILYLLPGRLAYPVTGRIASASANIAAFLAPQPEDKEPGPPVEQLRRELVLARAQLAATQNELRLLRQQLENISRIESSPLPQFAKVIPARVVLRRDASNFRRTILVNRGSEHGVRPGMPALWGCEHPQDGALPACVVGTVDTVGPRACRVLLASDPGFRVPARMLASRDRVIVEGRSAGSRPMQLKHVGTGARINPGDIVVTSGSLGLFPPGILVGIVASVEGREFSGEMEIALSSPVDLDELESVIIVEFAVPEVPEENK